MSYGPYGSDFGYKPYGSAGGYFKTKATKIMKFVQTSSFGGGSGSSTSLSLCFGSPCNPVTKGNMVAGIVTWGAGTNQLTSITDDGVGGIWVIKAVLLDAADVQGAACFYGYGWSTPPTHIIANFSPAQAFVGMSIMEFSGQAAGDPFDGANEQHRIQNSPGSGSNAVSSGTGTQTPAGAGRLIWGGSVDTFVAADNLGNFTAGTNFTEPNLGTFPGDGGANNAEAAATTGMRITSEYWIQGSNPVAANASFTVRKGTEDYLTFQMMFKPAT